MRVSARFSYLDKSSLGAPAPGQAPGVSRHDLFAQVRRPGICEPCSRRSSAGSIAAAAGHAPGVVGRGAPAVQRRAPLRRRTVTVGPPPRRAPAVRRRAPLRHHRPADSVDPSGHVLPPIDGGLHCGSRQGHCIEPVPVVLPPVNGGLHCGTVGAVNPQQALHAPADQRRAPLRLPGDAPRWRAPGCSRRSAAGSIAAPATPSTARGWPGAPAGRWRAPLRQQIVQARALGKHDAPAVQWRAPLRSAGEALARAQHVLPPVNGGLIAAGGVPDPAVLLVLPPFNGGLHCGPARRIAATGPRLVLPPFVGGLRCGWLPAAPVRPVGSPADRRRAQLPHPRRKRVSQRLPVLSPVNGGLHCGVRIRIRAQSSTGVLHVVDSASSGAEGTQASGTGATAVNGLYVKPT